ncbi:hypothetical protein [Frateuria defendens]|uniref:hypothetical protein n=1 Tax=Frateuria defendens TaxID=2219559 RepID=UPI00066FFEE8|nr:hypothetical protein [Frateuria defendens]
MSPALIVASTRRRFVLAAALLAVAVLAAAGAYRLLGAGHGGDLPPASAKAADGSGVAILLGLAREAVAEHRLIAPAGANAFEFCLSVLELDPGNAQAQDTLRQAFPVASAEVERRINALQLDEAQRELYLLRDYDGTNFTLALLGGKLDAQRQLLVRQDEARAERMQARAAAASPL